MTKMYIKVLYINDTRIIHLPVASNHFKICQRKRIKKN